MLFVFDDVILQDIGIFRRTVFHDGQINLVEVAVFHLHGHTREGLACLGKHHGTAHGTVDAMNQSGKHIARLVVFLLDVILDIVEKTHITGLVALHNLRRKLVDDNQMIILV